MTELNLDAWIDGAQRNTRSVTLYAAAHLLADIDELEAQKRAAMNVPEEDRSASDSTGDGLQEQIDELYLEIDRSKMVFRISFLDDDEHAAIREAVKAELKDEADAAATAARQEARDKCRRLDIKLPGDINLMTRQMANAAADAVIDREVNVRTIAAAVVSPQLSRDQVLRMYKKIGDAQIGLLSQAYSRASNEAPNVTVPKSQRPSRTQETGTSS